MILLRLVDYLEHIEQAVSRSSEYVRDMDREAFIADVRTQQAVTMNLIIIGEAANKIVASNADFVRVHPDFPWQAVRGMRNRMTHGYFDINLDTVWDTLQMDFPVLREKVHVLLQEQRQNPDA